MSKMRQVPSSAPARQSLWVVQMAAALACAGLAACGGSAGAPPAQVAAAVDATATAARAVLDAALNATPGSISTPAPSATADLAATATAAAAALQTAQVATLTALPTATATDTPSPTVTPTPSATPDVAATASAQETQVAERVAEGIAATRTAEARLQPTPTPTHTATHTPTETSTDTPRPTNSPTATNTPTDTRTPTRAPTATPTINQLATRLVLTLTADAARRATVTEEARRRATPTPTHTPTVTPTEDRPPISSLTFVTVVKLDGISWFNRMEEGVARFARKTGINATLVGPEQADAAQQIPIIEDLIAAGVNALCVVPMSPEALDPVLRSAMNAGVTVVTHESTMQVNTDYDIEPWNNREYGAHLMDLLAQRMGEEGEYAVFVGSLGSKTHNEWVDGGIARQQEAYPNMTLVGDKNESVDDSEVAYQKAKEVLQAYPNIKGFQGSASTDVAGIGRAVEELGLQDQIAVVGTSLPSIPGDDLWNSGAVDVISFWDPAVAGEACNMLALMHIMGEPVVAGTNLGLPGYESLSTYDGKVFWGNAWVDATRDNRGVYPF